MKTLIFIAASLIIMGCNKPASEIEPSTLEYSVIPCYSISHIQFDIDSSVNHNGAIRNDHHSYVDDFVFLNDTVLRITITVRLPFKPACSQTQICGSLNGSILNQYPVSVESAGMNINYAAEFTGKRGDRIHFLITGLGRDYANDVPNPKEFAKYTIN